MIVYNVKRRWFPMKNDAEAYRRSEGLPPAALYTLRIDNRDELAALLDTLCGAVVPPAAENITTGGLEVPTEVLERAAVPAEVEVPDYIPAFLVKAWRASQ